MLVEFPRLVALDAVGSALRNVVEQGLVPLLAHPERYSCCSPEAVARWRELGALMQVDATTLLQPSRRGDRARQLLAYGLADILAGDNHGDDRLDRDAARCAGRRWGRRRRRHPDAGQSRATSSQGKRLSDVPPLDLKLSIANRLRRLLVSEE